MGGVLALEKLDGRRLLVRHSIDVHDIVAKQFLDAVEFEVGTVQPVLVDVVALGIRHLLRVPSFDIRQGIGGIGLVVNTMLAIGYVSVVSRFRREITRFPGLK